MQEELARLDRRFKGIFLIFNLSWLGMTLLSLIWSAIVAFILHPNYLQEWRGVAIFSLILFVVFLYCSIIFVGYRREITLQRWPPPLPFSISYVGGLYILITLLSLLDNSFSWGYFIVSGMAYSCFSGRRLIGVVAFVFLSFAATQGDLSWPLTGSNLSALMSLGLTYTSITIVSMIIQHLIGERFERGVLLQQLAQSNVELAEAHRKLAETAVQEQELAVLRERTRLAREMHDTLGHALVLISVKLEVAQRLRVRDPERCDEELEATKEIVRTSMSELRASIANLRSPALEHEPVGQALRSYACEMAQRAGLQLACDLSPEVEDLPAAVAETLWKVGQEALTNIEKHASARHVILHMSRQASQVFLRIADDGVGMSAAQCSSHTESYQSPTGHYGLDGIQERVKNAHGQLLIQTAEAHGTAIEVTLPLVEMPLLTL